MQGAPGSCPDYSLVPTPSPLPPLQRKAIPGLRAGGHTRGLDQGLHEWEPWAHEGQSPRAPQRLLTRGHRKTEGMWIPSGPSHQCPVNQGTAPGCCASGPPSPTLRLSPGLLGPGPPPSGGARSRSPGQLFQLGLGIVQAVALHVLVRSVGQQLMQRQDVPGDLRWGGRGGGGRDRDMEQRCDWFSQVSALQEEGSGGELGTRSGRAHHLHRGAGQACGQLAWHQQGLRAGLNPTVRAAAQSWAGEGTPGLAPGGAPAAPPSLAPHLPKPRPHSSAPPLCPPSLLRPRPSASPSETPPPCRGPTPS